MSRSRPLLHVLATVLVGLLAACSDQRSSTETPHPLGRDWLDPTRTGFHGDRVGDASLDCSDCHDLAVDCFECHFGPDGSRSPQGSDWLHGTVPHADLQPYETVCNRCHGLVRDFGVGPASCHDCHADGHPTGKAWLDRGSPDFHGTSSLECGWCHNLDSKCSECHFGPSGSRSPSGSGWTHGTTPHADLKPYEAVCNRCHELDRSYGYGPATCHDCHGPGGHVMGQPWLDPASPTFHGASTLDCAACHDLASKCSECHFGPSGTKSPSGSGWTHGTVPHAALKPYEAVCNRCHDLDRSYGHGPANCHDCHGPGGHVVGRPWLDPASPTFHGASTLDCAACHDLASKCSECHFGPSGTKSPEGSGWTHGTVPHAGLAPYEAVCNRCHALDRSYGHGPADCHDCHGSGSHVLGRPWLDPASPTFHGASTLDCAACHDLASKCSECHFGPSGARSPAGSGWTHGTTPHADLKPNEAVCNRCHDLDRSYGRGPANCHDCHGPGGHALGQPWLDPASPTFHGTSTLDCAACHDLASKCSECHFGPSGAKSPVGSGWTHGTTPHATLSPYEAVCNRCHALDRSYGHGPGDCHDCHGPGGHVMGQPWLDPASPTFHGDSTLDCAACHDLASKCSECHFGPTGAKSPPGSGWAHGTTPHASLAPYEAVCNQCHALDRAYGHGPANCHDCHGPGGHVTGQAWLDPASPTFHGDSTLDCAACHDLSTECARCHFGPSGAKSPPGSGWTHGTTPHDGLAPYEAVCNQCHTLDRSYGHGPTSCHDCHGDGGHPLGRAWLDRSSPTFHGESSLDCAECHNLSTDCVQCHFGPSGAKSPPGSGWTHGSGQDHERLQRYGTVCNNCHALDRSYGHGPGRCHDCHGD